MVKILDQEYLRGCLHSLDTQNNYQIFYVIIVLETFGGYTLLITTQSYEMIMLALGLGASEWGLHSALH